VFTIIANHSNKTITVKACDLQEIKEPCEALGFNRSEEWANHLAGYMARERGYQFVKEEHEDSHRS
jgi:hypothetical protein